MQNERSDIMLVPGCFSDERVIRGIREQPSKRYPDDVYLTGYAQLDGQRTPVMTGHWGGVEIWQIDRDAPDWPTCKTCGSQLDIGSSQTWTCWPCHFKAHPPSSGLLYRTSDDEPWKKFPLIPDAQAAKIN